ncbi:D-mandelate dehydrogenase-like dehydrogenase [Rhodotorula paludigena]|uniref:D-mandelate dehydrogenase-like dehydrogenase n=1 Tax=Rhodotorula paludigena TaxID=86838 RepID=UPI00317B3B13
MSPSVLRDRVLLLDEISLAQPLLADLASKWEIVRLDSKSRDEFVADCKTKYDGVRAIYRHFKGPSTKVTGLFDPELVAALPQSLEFIAHNGAGYDQINVAACTERRIQVSNVPVAVDGATADTALFLLLGALRQFNTAQANLRAGKFNAGLQMSHDPEGKVLGIVGMGGIGRAFARRARALGMTVQYHNRSRLSPDLEDGATYLSSLDELLSSSDVVSLNLPLNAKTKHTMSTEQFKRMKKDAVLINTARGGVVDEAALVAALDQGEIAGCGLDVYEEEPKIHEGLLRLEGTKAFLLPHVGTLTVETQREMEQVCLRQIDHGLTTGKLAFWVPEQKDAF